MRRVAKVGRWRAIIVFFDDHGPRWWYHTRRDFGRARSLHRVDDAVWNTFPSQGDNLLSREGVGHAGIVDVIRDELRRHSRTTHRYHFVDRRCALINGPA